MNNNSWKQYPWETALKAQAKEEHAPGVRQRMNSSFKVEYIRQDGSIVPDYEYFLKLALEGII